MKLLHATGNLFKFSFMQNRLKKFDNIELVNPKMLGIKINVVEDGLTAEENSIKKAKAYYEATKLPTIAEDSGLFIEKFSKEDQPGLFVRRVNGKEDLSDEEILQYYINKLNEYGGESLANYQTSVCLVDKNGVAHSKTINETQFLLTSNKCEKPSIKGGILECISYDIHAKKYFDERSEDEQKEFYKKLDNEYIDLIKKHLL